MIGFVFFAKRFACGWSQFNFQILYFVPNVLKSVVKIASWKKQNESSFFSVAEKTFHSFNYYWKQRILNSVLHLYGYLPSLSSNFGVLYYRKKLSTFWFKEKKVYGSGSKIEKVCVFSWREFMCRMRIWKLMGCSDCYWKQSMKLWWFIKWGHEPKSSLMAIIGQ